jgi:hypothetical protein
MLQRGKNKGRTTKKNNLWVNKYHISNDDMSKEPPFDPSNNHYEFLDKKSQDPLLEENKENESLSIEKETQNSLLP